MRIAIFTDTHLGHADDDPVRVDDSFTAFAECLDISREQAVDAILHAGDLFHHRSPGPRTFSRAIDIIRDRILYPVPSPIEIPQYRSLLSDPVDPATGIPFFLIHGNHDPPFGSGQTNASDVFTSAGLINHIRRVEDADKIVLTPVVLRKGRIDVCVYGLGHQFEDEFVAALEQNRISLTRFPEEPGRRQFNVLLMHQLRPERDSEDLSVPQLLSGICGWMDLIVWGHEHESRVEVESCCGLQITQPGATVVTVFGDFEAAPRSMAVLDICEGEWHLTPIFLKSCRRFVWDTIEMGGDLFEAGPEEALDRFRSDQPVLHFLCEASFRNRNLDNPKNCSAFGQMAGRQL
jgi:double-strand break repair protein MRE11